MAEKKKHDISKRKPRGTLADKIAAKKPLTDRQTLWENARIAYELDGFPIPDIMQKFNVTFGAVQAQILRHKWVRPSKRGELIAGAIATKEDYVKHIFGSLSRQLGHIDFDFERATESHRFDALTYKLSQVVMMAVARKLAPDLIGYDEDVKPLEAHEMRLLTQCLIDAQTVGRLALGNSTQNISVKGDGTLMDQGSQPMISITFPNGRKSDKLLDLKDVVEL
jgi:hypothetical protein